MSETGLSGIINFREPVGGRLSKLRVVEHGVALGLSIAGSAASLTGGAALAGAGPLGSIEFTRFASLVGASYLRAGIQRGDFKERYGEEAWNRMKRSVYLSSAISGFASYFLLPDLARGVIGEPLVGLVDGVIPAEGLNPTAEMATTWALRMLTSLGLSQTLVRASARSLTVGVNGTQPLIQGEVRDNNRNFRNLWRGNVTQRGEVGEITGAAWGIGAQAAAIRGGAIYGAQSGIYNDLLDVINDPNVQIDATAAAQNVEILSGVAEVQPNLNLPNDVAERLVAPGNALAVNTEGNAFWIEIENSQTVPLQHPRTGFGEFLRDGQPDHLGGSLVEGLGTLTTEVNTEEIVVDWNGNGEYVTVTPNLPLTEEASQTIKEIAGVNTDNIMLVPRGDTGIDTVYVEGKPIGFRINENEIIVNRGGVYEVLDNDGNRAAFYNGAVVEEAIENGNVVGLSPDYIEIPDPTNPNETLRLVQTEVIGVDQDALPGQRSYTQIGDERFIYDMNGNLIAEGEMVVLNVNNEEVGRSFEEYLIVDQNTGDRYFTLEGGERINVIDTPQGTYYEAVINNETYSQGGNGIFFNSAPDAVPPYAYHLVDNGGGLEFEPYYVANVIEPAGGNGVPTVIELPFGADPSESGQLSLPAGYEYYDDLDSNDIVVLGPDQDGIQFVYRGDSAPGSQLLLQQNELAIQGDVQELAVAGNIRYIVPDNVEVEAGDLVVIVNSPSNINLTANRIAVMIGRENVPI